MAKCFLKLYTWRPEKTVIGNMATINEIRESLTRSSERTDSLGRYL